MRNVEHRKYSQGQKINVLYSARFQMILDGTGTLQVSEGTKFQEVLASRLVLNYFTNE